MKRITIAAVALGGAALFVIPAGVAWAVADAADASPGISRALGVHGNADAPGGGMGGPDGNGNSGPTGGNGNSGQTGGNGMGAGGMRTDGTCSTCLGGAYLVEPGSTATSEDAASLTFMVEEEKLAHDLYVELGEAWDLRVFTTIAAAEDQHADQVRSLLDAYGLDDPTDGMAVGEFANPALQDLYDDLLATGLESPTDALTVGGVVEETDIMDLRTRASSSAAIDQVFGQLESASENHLRAFVTNLARLGVDYEAQVMDDADVARILGQ